MSSNVTVKEVAEFARVGTSTVSRYVRGVTVRPAAAERIKAAIAQLNYVPDVSARALRSGKTSTLGVVIPKIANTFFSESMQHITREARARGFTVVLLTHEDSRSAQLEQLATLRRCRVDGVLLTAVPGTTLAEVRSALPNTPLVSFDSLLSSKVDSVLLDNQASARKATEHLLEHGYKRILCLTARPATYSYQQRILGYKQAVRVTADQEHLLVTETYDELRKELADIWPTPGKMDAVLALSDMVLVNVFASLTENRVPRAKWPPILAFDDFNFAPYLYPALTVLRQPISEMVGTALDLLFRQIQEDSPHKPTLRLFEAELVTRHSCGKHKRASVQ